MQSLKEFIKENPIFTEAVLTEKTGLQVHELMQAAKAAKINQSISVKIEGNNPAHYSFNLNALDKLSMNFNPEAEGSAHAKGLESNQPQCDGPLELTLQDIEREGLNFRLDTILSLPVLQQQNAMNAFRDQNRDIIDLPLTPAEKVESMKFKLFNEVDTLVNGKLTDFITVNYNYMTWIEAGNNENLPEVEREAAQAKAGDINIPKLKSELTTAIENAGAQVLYKKLSTVQSFQTLENSTKSDMHNHYKNLTKSLLRVQANIDNNLKEYDASQPKDAEQAPPPIIGECQP